MDYQTIKQLCIRHQNVDALLACDTVLKNDPSNENILIIKASLLRLCQDFDASLYILSNNSFSHKEKERNFEYLYNYVSMDNIAFASQQAIEIAKNYRLTDKEMKKLKEIHMSILGVFDPRLQRRTYPYNKSLNYNQKQLLNYSEDEAIRFIIGNKKFTRFAYDFDIVREFENFKDNYKSYERFISLLYDTYYVPFLNCGTNHDNNCDFYQIDTIKDTNHIVRMFPIPEEETMRYAREDYQKRYLKK